MTPEQVYQYASATATDATDPNDRATVRSTLRAIGYLLESDEDGLAHDLFQDWATACQEAGERESASTHDEGGYLSAMRTDHHRDEDDRRRAEAKEGADLW